MIQIIAGAFALLGLVFIALYLRSRKQAATSQSWPGTPGTITASEMNVVEDDESGDVYAPSIAYEYRVGDRPFTSHRIRFGSASSRDRAKAEAVLGSYPAGKEVTVYYDPARPDQAVLEQSAAGSASFLYLGIGFLAFGILAPFIF